MSPAAPYWAIEPDELLRRLGTSGEGPSASEAEERARVSGPNRLLPERRISAARLLLRQLSSPLLLLLVFAVGISLLTAEWADAAVVFAILAASAGMGLQREYTAQSAAEALRAKIRTQTTVVRDGRAHRRAVEDVVPGDIVLLASGSLVPADLRLL
jgi:Mg2+-importing ATPase